MIIAIFAIAILAISLFSVYNSLVRKRNDIIYAFSDIDVMLKKRFDLIPDLIAFVQQYVKYETSTFAQITEMRNTNYSALSTSDKVKFDEQFTQWENSFFAVAENDTDLKASENFLQLQRSLNETEEQVSTSRQTYNAAVIDYNNLVESIPILWVASIFGFAKKTLLKISLKKTSQNNMEINEALKYHEDGRPGKIEVIPTKPYSTQRHLSLAYSPGVAQPCLAIEKNPEDAYRYTAKGNLVAVISNGTAVLGLGDIGALASKPVMEGKGLLFKIFADVDVFDIEVDTKNIEEFIQTVKMIAPTFGGINLEDIKAPECFEIERRLKAELDIPVMHDDQHGTAIISGAGLLNALELNGKHIEDIRVVINGAGAAAISCGRFYLSLGVKKDNIIMCDSKGVIFEGRTDLNIEKQEFVTATTLRTLEEVIVGADMFLGLSKADVLSEQMVQNMAKDPIVFALANPNPEISYEKAMDSRSDIIFATGRSDYPNQINNVLGFPYIFRGALDVHATNINEEMKLAATYAIAKLTKEEVLESVKVAYDDTTLTFNRNYIIPKPLDKRLISYVAFAVAKAAVESGVAKKDIEDWDAYRENLENRIGQRNI